MGGIPENMEIDDGLDDDQQSLHVQFDLDAQSVGGGSVATAVLDAVPREEVTPPPSPRNAAKTTPNAKKTAQSAKRKKNKKKRKKKRKKRFARDEVIELSNEELRARDMETADFIHQAGRDAIHIWREFPLSTLTFDELITQPLSKLNFRKWPEDVAKRFALCNEDKPNRNAMDELDNVNVLRHGDDVEQGRDDGHGMGMGMEHDLSMPMNDLSMGSALGLDDSIQDHLHQAMHEKERLLDVTLDDVDSVIDDAIPVPADPLYNDDMIGLELDDLPIGGEEEDIDVVHQQPLEFDTEDQDILTQAPLAAGGAVVDSSGIKPRDWSKRAKKTFLFFKNKDEEEFSFDELMTPQTKRNTVVGIFYELLVLKNSDLVDLQQEKPFGDITITKTKHFHRHAEISKQLSQRY